MLDTIETTAQTVDMKARQLPLRETYSRLPSAAQITDHARTCSDTISPGEPLYGEVEFGDPNRTRLSISLHEGVGGKSDLPVPGELFSAAIASCLDSTIRVIANMLGVRLKSLEISVECAVDLRGTLRMDPEIPVAFGNVEITANMVPDGDVPPATLDAIFAAAEHSCVVLQTLRNPPDISLKRT